MRGRDRRGSILPDGTVLYPAASDDNLNLCATIHAAVHFLKVTSLQSKIQVDPG